MNYTNDLLVAIDDLEQDLADNEEITKAVLRGCIAMNKTISPMVALLNARDKLQKIKELVNS